MALVEGAVLEQNLSSTPLQVRLALSDFACVRDAVSSYWVCTVSSSTSVVSRPQQRPMRAVHPHAAVQTVQSPQDCLTPANVFRLPSVSVAWYGIHEQAVVHHSYAAVAPGPFQLVGHLRTLCLSLASIALSAALYRLVV